jgi:hypothetical protein
LSGWPVSHVFLLTAREISRINVSIETWRLHGCHSSTLAVHLVVSGQEVDPSSKSDPRTLVGLVRRILASRQLTLADVCRTTRGWHPQDSRFYIQPDLYHDLRAGDISPSLHQLVALSRITSYRLADWLAVFGFHLDTIPRLQAALPNQRTALLDSTVYDTEAWVRSYADAPTASSLPGVAPLSRLLAAGAPQRAGTFSRQRISPYIYAKVGWQDAFAFPDLLPGSVVRVDVRRAESLAFRPRNKPSNRLFLIEHSRGLTLSQVHPSEKRRITLRSKQLPYAQVELKVGDEAKILGVADTEIRPLINQRKPEVLPELAHYWKPTQIDHSLRSPTMNDFLRKARNLSGLSFRDASAKSNRVAQLLRDHRYFISSGSLSDCEARGALPRHIHKIMTLCILYPMQFFDLIQAAGLDLHGIGTEPIPDNLLSRPMPPSIDTTETSQRGCLGQVAQEFSEIPLFLYDALDELSGLSRISLRDIFWVGSHRNSHHPYLARANFVIVNRRYKRPASSQTALVWAQPLYILLLRDGTYLCTGCSTNNGILYVHPFSDGAVRPIQMRTPLDAEVIGKVTAIVRHLP